MEMDKEMEYLEYSLGGKTTELGDGSDMGMVRRGDGALCRAFVACIET